RFALLQALPGAPSIAELESLDERHGENGDGGPDWRLALEELAARHPVERRFSDGEVRFAIPDTVREVEWSGRLSSDETTRVLERSLRILRTPSLHGAPPERLALLSSISSRLGRSDDALRFVLVASRELARRHRFAAASRLLEDAASRDLSRGSLFAHAAFILRTARSALAAGRASEARSALARVPIRDAGVMPWIERALLLSRAALLERSGDLDDARLDLERALRLEESGKIPSADDPRCVELRARLVRILYRSGERERGEQLLREARELIDESVAIARGGRLWAETLELQATVELVHGDTDLAASYLDRAIRLHDVSGTHAEVERALGSLAVIEARRGRIQRALELFARAEGIAIARGDLLAELQARLNRAHACLRARAPDEAEM